MISTLTEVKMIKEVLMVIDLTISMLGGNTFPIQIEMITTEEHCQQEIKNFNPIKLNFVGNVINVVATCQPLTESFEGDIIDEKSEEGVTL